MVSKIFFYFYWKGLFFEVVDTLKAWIDWSIGVLEHWLSNYLPSLHYSRFRCPASTVWIMSICLSKPKCSILDKREVNCLFNNVLILYVLNHNDSNDDIICLPNEKRFGLFKSVPQYKHTPFSLPVNILQWIQKWYSILFQNLISQFSNYFVPI